MLPAVKKRGDVRTFINATVVYIQYSAKNTYLRNSVGRIFRFPFLKSLSEVKVFIRLQIPGVDRCCTRFLAVTIGINSCVLRATSLYGIRPMILVSFAGPFLPQIRRQGVPFAVEKFSNQQIPASEPTDFKSLTLAGLSDLNDPVD